VVAAADAAIAAREGVRYSARSASPG